MDGLVFTIIMWLTGIVLGSLFGGALYRYKKSRASLLLGKPKPNMEEEK
jgi:hypothetical protein